MSLDQLSLLRKEINTPPNKANCPRPRYTKKFKANVVDYMNDNRKSVVETAAELGVSQVSLNRWLRIYPEKQTTKSKSKAYRKFRKLEISDSPKQNDASEITVEVLGGITIKGLDVSDLPNLLKALKWV